MNNKASEVNAEVCVSKIFKVMQALSGQGNVITIPVPYLDFFAGDRQAHLLAAILNQLVFWSGKSRLHDGWFYKGHEELAVEVRAVSEDSIRRAMDRIIKEYLPDAIEQKLRKVSGTPRKHYRINEEILLLKIFPETSDSALTPNGNGVSAETAKTVDSALTPNGNGANAESTEVPEIVDSALTPNGNGANAECIPHLRRMETALTPNPGIGVNAESILYTDLKNRLLLTDIKTTREKNSPVDNFAGDETKTELATSEDFELSRWFWSTVLDMYERAAEFDGMIARPREPNLSVWANEIRLLREGHGCTHEQIQNLIERVQRDPWWCSKVQDTKTLRSKWAELVLKLCPGNLTTNSDPFGSSFNPDNEIPKGFRG